MFHVQLAGMILSQARGRRCSDINDMHVCRWCWEPGRGKIGKMSSCRDPEGLHRCERTQASH